MNGVGNITPSEHTDDAGLRAKRPTRYDRPSALAGAVELPDAAGRQSLSTSSCCNGLAGGSATVGAASRQ
jgi:hypothetical protein